MSILIKGMDMPVEGLVTVNIHSDGTVYVYGAYPTELHEAVSVPTPHGRLIDADALKKHYDSEEFDETIECIAWMPLPKPYKEEGENNEDQND